MAGFTFKLDGVLEQRRRVEGQLQRELGLRQQAMLRLQAERDALQAMQRASSAELRPATGTGTGAVLSAAALASHQRFALAVRQKMRRLHGQFADAQADLERAQAAALESTRQRKILEKLREREHARWISARRKLDHRRDEETTASAAGSDDVAGSAT